MKELFQFFSFCYIPIVYCRFDGVDNLTPGILFRYLDMSNSYFSLNKLRHNIFINSNKKMTLEISEIVLAKSFLVIGLLAFTSIGFASLVNQKQRRITAK